MKTQMKISGLLLGALLILSLADSVARADTADSTWQISVPAYLSAGAYHLSRGTVSHSFNSVNASAEILISSPDRPYSAALFVDYHYSPDEQFNGIFNRNILYRDERANIASTHARMFPFMLCHVDQICCFFISSKGSFDNI